MFVIRDPRAINVRQADRARRATSTGLLSEGRRYRQQARGEHEAAKDDSRIMVSAVRLGFSLLNQSPASKMIVPNLNLECPAFQSE